MSYRNERDALRARVDDLEQELASAQKQQDAEEAEHAAAVEALEHELRLARKQLKRARAGPKRRRTAGVLALVAGGAAFTTIALLALRPGPDEPARPALPTAPGATTASPAASGRPHRSLHEPCPARSDRSAVLSSPTLVVEPGRGVGPVVIGTSTVQDVIDAFGDHCAVSRYSSGEIFHISYSYRRDLQWQRNHEAQRRTPAEVEIADGVVVEMSFGVYQRDFRTPGGVTSSSSRQDMAAEFGDDYHFQQGDPLDKYSYPSLGIEFWLQRSSDQINSFLIRAPRASRVP